ncbi:hypothetical protein QWY85_03395 [Neolewinella lacunae]|uniref:Uncharacterized protein n=1 Tax=Neolewinella lacunae TaxID=1517758 RepID=A0A923T621_9BACT|nr:hypothetical protein [Neolewinella lacunae]MBC6992950.1 hypothetical protein [Neolewinella lacunae]MDN3633686.1 hypothetical protein [Neolewinella lacunae]
MEPELEVLKAELIALRAVVAEDRAQRLVHVREKYKNVNQLFQAAISDARSLQDGYESLLRELSLSSIITFIGDINNPVGTKLGFSFMEAIEAAVQKAFLEPLLKEEDGEVKKQRLTDILDKVLKNPLATALLRTNPVSGIISKVVDIASGFVATTLTGTKPKEMFVATREVINKERIANFVNQVEKYEELYTDMYNANIKLERSNDYIKLSMEEELGFSKDAYEKFLTLLSISRDTPFKDLSNLFSKSDELNFSDLEAFLDNQKIQQALKFVRNMEDARIRLTALRGKFTVSIKEFKEDYLIILNKPLEGNWADVDEKQLRNTIEQLQKMSK